VTLETRKARRRAPVYLDIMRNAPGQTIAPPFAVRWRPRAPVSMPLDWDEVSPRLDPVLFNIKTAERRMRAKSPWSSFFGHRQTLPRV
jgi:bifunctional non-homologous end joining protein LigD